jgi:molecular chaperone DnaJ
MARDYYEILGVKSDAPEAELKRAYRTLSKKYHPDRNPSDPTAEGKFKEVQEAYATLGNKEKRAEYDRFGAAGVGRWQTKPGGERVYQWGGGSAVNVEDLEDLFSAFGGGGEHASVFDQFFGRGRGGGGLGEAAASAGSRCGARGHDHFRPGCARNHAWPATSDRRQRPDRDH